MLIHRTKNYLIKLGPNHWAVRVALRVAAARKGWKVEFGGDGIHMVRNQRELILGTSDFVYVPWIVDFGEFYLDTMLPDRQDRHGVWDYTKPGWHRYRSSGLEFYAPALPEEDLDSAYTHSYKPVNGDTVWDVGAHAGYTSYQFSKLVGPTGRVYAWEPDASNYSCLLRNIERHKLENVTPVHKALAGETGRVRFEMDGTMASGIQDYLEYPDAGVNVQAVDGITIADACAEFGIPRYVKMDIEGAEVAVIRSSLEFISRHPIEWAIDTHHRIDNRFTYSEVENLLRSAGYSTHSSTDYGNWWCTWASPLPRAA